MLDFLRTGVFGGIKPGITRQELEQIVGTPSVWSVTKRRKRREVSAIWLYGSIEFHFADWSDTIWMIFSDHWPLKGSVSFELDPWILTENLTLPDAVAALKGANLNFLLTTDLQIERTELALDSGVALGFYPPPEIWYFDCEDADAETTAENGLPSGTSNNNAERQSDQLYLSCFSAILTSATPEITRVKPTRLWPVR